MFKAKLKSVQIKQINKIVFVLEIKCFGPIILKKHLIKRGFDGFVVSKGHQDKSM